MFHKCLEINLCQNMTHRITELILYHKFKSLKLDILLFKQGMMLHYKNYVSH